ncbi:uncharacterized protein [Rutidosis leptorrhynchoides]|uniref:uncharacterized protein n=1 Tax=Rutidosis leptorrhynchoides TaxID=125765 RepID=UPI003A9949F5
MEDASSPLSAQILEFCQSELFQETLQNSDVASASNCCYEEQSSYVKDLSFPHEMIKYPASGPTNMPSENVNSNFGTMFEEKLIENDISLPLDFTNLPQYPCSNQDQFDLSLLQNNMSLSTEGPIPQYPHPIDQTNVLSMMGPIVCDDDCLSSMPPSKCMRMNNLSPPNNCFLDHPYNTNPLLSVESCGIFNGNWLPPNENQAHDLDFQGENSSIFFQDPLSRPYNSNELQELKALSNDRQHVLNNGSANCNTSLVTAPEITNLESETFRVANKLTSEERKEKINRYMKKRHERNFSKKIKYACRKTLADSRPRVRGRFAKNDEFGEHHIRNPHEEDTDEDVKSMHVVVKEEEKLDSSDIFAHISGMNSFRCNYPIQSWI